MHELSIALGIVEAGTEELARLGETRAFAVHLKLGPLAGVDKEALLFSYTLACEGTPLEGSQLLIEDVPLRIYCTACDAPRAPVSIQAMSCSVCGAAMGRVMQGTELELFAIELYEPELRT